jgi:hypothetical protein
VWRGLFVVLKTKERKDIMSVSGTLWLEEGWLLEDLHARVLGCTYREASWFVPLLRVELTRPLGGVPAGTRLTLRLNDYEGRGRWRVRWRWRLMLPGTRVVARDGQLGEEGEVLREGSELWVLYLDKEQ